MKSFLFASAAIVAVAASFSQASPVINGAHINAYVFQDMPGTTFTPTNSFPALINLNEFIPADLPNHSNLHNWRLSADGGATNANFANGDSFQISASVTVTGNANGEAGLNYLCPGLRQFFAHALPRLQQLAGVVARRHAATA